MRSTVLVACAALVAGACTEPTRPDPSAVRNFALSAAMGSHASVVTFVAHLSGDEEVPARETNATGQAIFKIRRSDDSVRYKLIVANIDNAFAAHIHCGRPGVNGPIVVGLFSGSPASGVANGIIASSSFHAAGFTCAGMSLLDAMGAGETYVNVHTNDNVAPANTGAGDFPGGEIRGLVRTAGH